MKSIAQEHDCLLIDLDGTVFCGRQPTGGAVQSLSQVRSRKLFVTNNASRSADEVAAHLCELGFTATGEDVVTSAQSAAHLLAGASWMAEYGDPDNPDDWKFISEYSPYQNISANRKYPPVLMTTSTRDDRVHPGHARKMTAALQAAGHPVWYYENIEGGHAGAADNAQIAFKSALSFAFLWRMLAG